MARLTLEFEQYEELEEKIKEYFQGQKLISFTWDFEQEVLRKYKKYDLEQLISNCKKLVMEYEPEIGEVSFEQGVFACLSFIEKEYYRLKKEWGDDQD
jgi:HEPN domain-containing protein